MPFSSARFYSDVNQGNVFIGTTAIAGVALPAYNATAHTFCVWNPLGSQKNIIPISLLVGYITTTSAAGNVVISYQNGMGSQVASGAAITAATLVAPLNAKLGAGNSSIAKFAPGTITFGAATSLLMTTGLNEDAFAATSAANQPKQAKHDFEGTLMVPPGSAICVAGNIALLSTFDVTMIWGEVPQQ